MSLIRDLPAVAFLELCFQRKLRFILRWHKGYHLREVGSPSETVADGQPGQQLFIDLARWDALEAQRLAAALLVSSHGQAVS